MDTTTRQGNGAAGSVNTCCVLSCFTPRPSFLPLGASVQSLGLALMVGGMLALGAFTAPAVFGQLPREQAAPVMATIFRRYDIVLQVALVLVLLGEGLRLLSRQIAVKSKLSMARYGLLVLLTGGILFSTLKLNADIERMNRAGWHRDFTAQGQQFERTHKLSETLYKIEMLAALLLLLLTPFSSLKAASASLSKDEGACCPSSMTVDATSSVVKSQASPTSDNTGSRVDAAPVSSQTVQAETGDASENFSPESQCGTPENS